MHIARTLPHPLLLSPAARSSRTAPCPRLARDGSACRVLTTAKMMDRIGEPRLASASVTFDRFAPSAPAIYDTSASGIAVEAGVFYEFDVYSDGEVRLFRNDRRVPGKLKAPLRATVLAVFRAAQAERALISLSVAVDRAVAQGCSA